VPVPPAAGNRLGESEISCRSEGYGWPGRARGDVVVGEQQVVELLVPGFGVRHQRGNQSRVQPEPPRAPTLGVGLDDEPLAVGAELRLHLGNRAVHCDDPARLVHIAQPQLDQLAPAQPGLDGGLDEQLSGRGPQGRMQPVELLRRQDAVLLDRHGRRLHAPTWVQGDHEVVERRGEDGGQHDLVVPDRCGGDAGRGERRHPLAHVHWQDRGHPHRPERRQDVPVEVVAVALPGARLEDVVREPRVVDVGPEAHATAARVGGSTGGVHGLHLLPGPVGVAAGGERPGGPLPALRVQVVGGVARAAALADPLAAETHPATLAHLTVI
jgi:hypothetical protein